MPKRHDEEGRRLLMTRAEVESRRAEFHHRKRLTWRSPPDPPAPLGCLRGQHEYLWVHCQR